MKQFDRLFVANNLAPERDSDQTDIASSEAIFLLEDESLAGLPARLALRVDLYCGIDLYEALKTYQITTQHVVLPQKGYHTLQNVFQEIIFPLCTYEVEVGENTVVASMRESTMRGHSLDRLGRLAYGDSVERDVMPYDLRVLERLAEQLLQGGTLEI